MKKHGIESRGLSEARTDGDIEPLKSQTESVTESRLLHCCHPVAVAYQ
ncbi:MAG: hypothetical protein J07HQW2_00355 [Haloquadratum walsbyi J07HQW2]|uniref:Uncharacterized protein n=1 Tax=Haloquadratum walsbyi J07HQW2 TaxID=1238425 RepID=U1PNS9_9EURY|nr:MAG: hypothetical protein J07HQW2_00355 [Haloquadratum walsbyi J07HQW2]